MYEIPIYTTVLTVGEGWIVQRGERVIARDFRTRKLARQYIKELKEWHRTAEALQIGPEN